MIRGHNFYIHSFITITITITTIATNGIGQHEPAEKGAKCQVSDHISIGSEVSKGLSAWGGKLVVDAHAPVECVGWETYS